MFPANITIEDCRKATSFLPSDSANPKFVPGEPFPGFRENHKGELVFFNYDFAFRETFPDPELAGSDEERRLLQIRRFLSL